MRRALVPIATLAGMLASAGSALANDTVFLKNGGRVRGVVVEEDPQTGVRVKLADGTITTVAAADVERVDYESAGGAAPVAPPTAPPAPLPPVAPPPIVVQPGTIEVSTTRAGSVRLGGGQRGTATPEEPLVITGVPPGQHAVRIDFDDGGNASEKVSVGPGQVTKLTLEPSAARAAFDYRRGVHLGASIAPMWIHFADEHQVGHKSGYAFNGASATPYESRDYGPFTYGGGRAIVFLNIGLVPAVDLRASAFGTFAGGEGFLAPVGASFAARFNLGSIYSIWAGAFGGYAFRSRYIDTDNCGTRYERPGVCNESFGGGAPFFGPEVSVAGFRFKERRQFEVELRNGIGIGNLDGNIAPWIEGGVAVSYLLLGEKQ